MNFFFREYPVSDNALYDRYPSKEIAYSRLEDLFLFLGYPDRQALLAVRPYFTYEVYPKKSFLLSVGQATDKLFFIAEGATRSYIVDEEKEERTLLLLTEGNLVTCMDSYLAQTISNINIVATEDVVALSINYDAMVRVFNEVPGALLAFSNALSKVVVFQQDFSDVLKFDTRKKFRYVHDKLSPISNRFQLQHQASFLGIKPETLSRIRAAQVRVKPKPIVKAP